MDSPPLKTLHYKRSHFATQLPIDYLYLPSHAWLARADGGTNRWRAGLTKFATRMLGEMVDHAIDIQPRTPVRCGEIIGWVEGFKAISDLYCVVDGTFVGPNTGLKENITRISKDPFGAGWLYEADGTPDTKAMDVHAYRDLLDKAIDRILAEQKGKEIL